MIKRILLWMLVASALGRWAAAQPRQSTAPITLDTVAVSGKVQQLTLFPPGETGDTPRGTPLPPSRRIAVLYRPPTLAHEYDLRSLTLHFSSRDNSGTAGRALVQLTLPDSSGNPSGTDLLPSGFELTARQIQHAKKLTLTLSLQGARLTLPQRGIFVVLTGLPEVDERFIKDTVITVKSKQFPSMAAVKVQNIQTGRYRVVNVADYISPAIVRTAQQPVSWHVAQHDNQWHQLQASYPNCPKCLIFNYWIDLGVNEL